LFIVKHLSDSLLCQEFFPNAVLDRAKEESAINYHVLTFCDYRTQRTTKYQIDPFQSNQSINQSINQPINQSYYHSTYKMSEETTHLPKRLASSISDLASLSQTKQNDQFSMEAMASLLADKLNPLIKATEVLQGSMADVSKRLVAVESRVATGEARASAMQAEVTNIVSTLESITAQVAVIPVLSETVRSSTEVITTVKAELGNVYAAANGLRDAMVEKVDGLQAESKEMKAMMKAGADNWNQIPGLLEAARSSDIASQDLRIKTLKDIRNLQAENAEMKAMIVAGAGHWTRIPELLEAARSLDTKISELGVSIGKTETAREELRDKLLKEVHNPPGGQH